MSHFQSITYSYLYSSTLIQCKIEECGYSGSTPHSPFQCNHTNKSYVWSGWRSSRLYPACLLLYSCPHPLPLCQLAQSAYHCNSFHYQGLCKQNGHMTGKERVTPRRRYARSVHGLLFLTMQYFRSSQQCSWRFNSMGPEYSFPDFSTGAYHC